MRGGRLLGRNEGGKVEGRLWMEQASCIVHYIHKSGHYWSLVHV